ncbi:c-type cytochrome [Chlorobium phaeovibrioides]|uniref:c-type cytochrome n=1 Tax=Chlorobium phaeovibrioides TaxID=1094 RepID=UPI001230CB61|nr:c-type cytochrome [Chlorobium phaeovibrioides]QEQ56694.1 cytochrome c5 family protein [Chlorobium phaeovibrioides]
MRRILYSAVVACSLFLCQQSLQAAPPDPAALRTQHDLVRGGSIYNSTCAVCHNTGIMGAPKPGDKVAWSARVAGGFAPVLANSIKGFKGMPARGGKQSLTDAQIADAVAFMVAKSL